ncbi:hypothetical protein Taro_045256 [Colocasia esculenta]|uniref:Uncharacterized protein n=1 Tax=Colocasia esculenta TaxID=4460 RepID=A0A843X6C0_COLES|nr:hypothetical protein [Colocasia esculenta]
MERGGNVNPDESLRQEIRIDIDSVPWVDEKSWWICRLHPSIREKECQAYEPKLVSVGPLHHGNPSLQPMEGMKKRYVRKLLARSPKTNTLESYMEAIRGIEGRAKEEYPEHEVKGFTSDAFAKMLLVDGCFIIEYMLREFFEEKQEEGNGMWGSFPNLERDLMLLENQIPFFVLQQLVALRLIKQVIFCLLFVLLINEWPWCRREPDLLKKIPCASDLDISGIKFKKKVPNKEEDYNIAFRRGALEIPFVVVGQTLSARLRNLIALEQCQRDHLPCHCTTYVSFMNSIIYTESDVALLRKYRIIEILFGTDGDVANMFRSIYEDANLYKVENKAISELSKRVNEYGDVAYHRWRGRLRSSYLRSPWSTVALLFGTVVLGLTVTQTIFTIRQSYN